MTVTLAAGLRHADGLWLREFAAQSGLPCPTDGSGDVAPLIIAAVAQAASQGTIPKIILPDGTLNCVGPIGRIPRDVLFASATGKTQINFGTTIQSAVRGGLCAMEFESPTYPGTPVLSGVALTGTFNGSIPSQAAPPELYGTGVRIHSGSRIENCNIQGFCHPIDWRGDHNQISNTVTGGWDGLFFGPGDYAQADGQIDHFSPNGNWACVAVSHSYTMAAVQWEGGHMFGRPYGIWKVGASRRDPNYSTGTVSVANTTTRVVTGVGTSWLASVKRGANIIIGAGTPVTIFSVDSDTQITLLSAYGATVAAGTTYVIQESAQASATSVFINGVVFVGVKFESLANGLITAEEAGSVLDSKFIGCDQANSGGGAAGYAAITAPDAVSNCEFVATKWWQQGWKTASIITNNCSGNDFGEIGPEVVSLATQGIPFVATPTPGAELVTQGNNCKLQKRPAIVAALGNVPGVVPGDVVQSSPWTYPGNQYSAHKTAQALPRGVAQVMAGTFQGTVIQTGGLTNVNVAQSVVVTATAAAGATTLTVLDTTVLGANTTAVTLVDSTGATKASGTVASATTCTVGALAAQIVKGTQLWIQRTAPVTTAAQVVKPRFGATGGGTTNLDRGQIVGGTNFADTDNPVLGETMVNDNGRQASVLLR